MSRWLALSAALLGMGSPAFAPDAPYPPVVTFAVLRNGENIGRHVITFQQKGDSRIVTIDVDITVRALGVVAYRYVHHCNEVWVGRPVAVVAGHDRGQWPQVQRLRATRRRQPEGRAHHHRTGRVGRL